jgi:transcriptional regulator with XRE-family HTH domain
MKNSDLGKKIKDLRNRKGLSQEQLAEVAQLSLRTVQRIENGETEARGDTLQRLAHALNITPEELTQNPPLFINEKEPDDNNHHFLALLNLSALSFILFPVLGIAVPWGLWLLNRKKLKNIDHICKRIINFQISWSLLITVMVIALLTANALHVKTSLGLSLAEIILIVISGMYTFNFVFILFNSFLALSTRKIFYQPAVPFLR